VSRIHPPGRDCQKLRHRWKGLLSDGKRDKLLGELRAAAEQHAPRPAQPADLPPGSPARILWTRINYIEEY
jgi:hypothetical protein